MLKAGVRLDQGIAISQAMYGNNFQPSESLKAMTYFEGSDLQLLTEQHKQTLMRAASAVRDLPAVRKISTELSVDNSGR